MDGAPLHGTARGERVVAGIRLSETLHAPGQLLVSHAHATASMCLVLAGGFRERVGARELACAPATLLVRAPGVEHGDAFGASASRCFNIELPALPAGPTGVDADSGRRAWAAARLLGEVRAGADDLVVEGLALELAALGEPDLDDRARHARDAVRGVDDQLRARLTEQVSLQELADRIGCHPMHLTRLFRRAHGTSIGEHVRALRVAQACGELARTSRPVAEIAAGAGFTDQAHLTRVFRRVTGTTPGRYRALFRA